MQDIHAVGGGPFLGGGDRRMRAHNHPNNHLQALKCPRCDSQNTKFCYYNNYNLSQPRHFCKNCRRYWTKGGVLRNVPIGGGCRKTKRTNQRRGAARERTQSTSSTDSSNNHTIAASSSSAVVEEPSAATKAASISAAVYDFPDSSFFNANPSFDNRQPLVTHPSDAQIFPSEIGGYASLMEPAPASEMMVYGVVPCPTTSYPEALHDSTTTTTTLESCNQAVEEIKLPEIEGELNCGDISAVPEWASSGGGEDQGLFDLTAAVDPAYWSQPPWTDTDQSSLNFLP